MAIWVYNMTVETGHFAVLRRSFGAISEDQRIQAVIIAFCFGALMEALAGFGTPVAITAVMLIALGFKPIKAASLALVANTAPVAFGAIATPIITLSEVTSLDKGDLGAMVGRQTPFLALIVPLILIGMVDGAAAQAGVAGGRGRRTQLRRRPVRRELHLGRADGHRGVARRNGLDRRVPAYLDSRRAARWPRTRPPLAASAAGGRQRVGARPSDGAPGRSPGRHRKDTTGDVVRVLART